MQAPEKVNRARPRHSTHENATGLLPLRSGGVADGFDDDSATAIGLENEQDVFVFGGNREVAGVQCFIGFRGIVNRECSLSTSSGGRITNGFICKDLLRQTWSGPSPGWNCFLKNDGFSSVVAKTHPACLSRCKFPHQRDGKKARQQIAMEGKHGEHPEIGRPARYIADGPYPLRG